MPKILDNPVDRIWVVLLVATLITFALGESGLAGSAGWLPLLLMFGLAYMKSVLVILEFMELRHAPALWRWLLLGWLTVVTSGIVWAWWLGVRGA